MCATSLKKRVVITGVGVVSPIGIGKEVFVQSLYEGTSGIDYISLFDASNLPTKFAGEVKGFNYEDLLSGMEILRYTKERRLLLANAAARLAVEDANLSQDTFSNSR